MGKKKKLKIQPIIITNIRQRINWFKFANVTSYRLSYLIKINKTFNLVIKSMVKCNLFDNDQIYPSIFINFYKNIQIKPFWNNEIQLLSDKLFLPSIDNINKLNENTIRTFNSNTWFTVDQFAGNNQKYYQLKLKNNEPNNNKIVKCKKIKMYLTKEQKYIIKKVIGTYRYFYNRCVSYFNNYNKKTNTSYFYIDANNNDTMVNVKLKDEYPYSYLTVRKYIKNNYPEWILPNYPSHLIDQAIIEASNRFITCLNQSVKKGIRFQFKYKSKKELYQTVNLEKTMISTKYNGIFSGWKINEKHLFKHINTSENIKGDILGSSITYHKILNSFVLNINYTDKIKTFKGTKICAIDQGVRTPFAIYNPEEVIQIGNGCNKKLYKVCQEVDILKSRIDRKTYYEKSKFDDSKKEYIVNSKRKRNLKKALHRQIQKIKNIKKELHNKTVKYLCDTYKTIILPPFETQKMAGNLRCKISRNMYTLSFYEFKQKLVNRCKEYNIRLLHLSEPFTSKTCGKCGKIKKNLGNAKEFKCSFCNIRIERDINGARNILLRNMKHI